MQDNIIYVLLAIRLVKRTSHLNASIVSVPIGYSYNVKRPLNIHEKKSMHINMQGKFV
jgi:hypothetical protein